MLREARAAAALDHPNVVAIFDVGQITEPEELRGTTYLAMELIRGEPLRKFIGDASLKMRVRVRWLEEIARARGGGARGRPRASRREARERDDHRRQRREGPRLRHCEARRGARRSIRPSSTEGFVVSTTTSRGVVMGTPMYMAPEQLRGESLDGRVDQFAWGVVAYELLTAAVAVVDRGGRDFHARLADLVVHGAAAV